MATSSWMPQKRKPQTDEELMQSLGLGSPNSSAMPPTPGDAMAQPSFPQATAPENLGAVAQGAPAPAMPPKPAPVARKPRPIISPALAPNPLQAQGPTPEEQAMDAQHLGLKPNQAYRPGSGQQTKDKVMTDDSEKNVDKVSQIYGDDQVRAGLKNIRNTPEFQKMIAAEDRLPDLLKMTNQRPIQMDLSPLMALANYTTHGEYKPDYNPPETIQARNKELLSNIMKSQDDKRDIVKSLIAGFASQRSPGFNQLVTSSDLKNAAEQNSIAARLPTAGKGAGEKPYDPTKDVKELQKSLEPLAGLHSSMNNLQQAIEADIGGPLSQWDGKKDISGVGASKMLPQALLSNSGAKVREAYAQMQNELSNAYYGKRLTQTEINRLNKAMGAGISGTDRDLVMGMGEAQKTLKDIAKQREASKAGLIVNGSNHGKIIMDAYRRKGESGEGGGWTSDSIPDTPLWVPPAKGAKSAGPAAPTKPLDQMSQQELDAYEASLHQGGK